MEGLEAGKKGETTTCFLPSPLLPPSLSPCSYCLTSPHQNSSNVEKHHHIKRTTHPKSARDAALTPAASPQARTTHRLSTTTSSRQHHQQPASCPPPKASPCTQTQPRPTSPASPRQRTTCSHQAAYRALPAPHLLPCISLRRLCAGGEMLWATRRRGSRMAVGWARRMLRGARWMLLLGGRRIGECGLG